VYTPYPGESMSVSRNPNPAPEWITALRKYIRNNKEIYNEEEYLYFFGLSRKFPDKSPANEDALRAAGEKIATYLLARFKINAKEAVTGTNESPVVLQGVYQEFIRERLVDSITSGAYEVETAYEYGKTWKDDLWYGWVEVACLIEYPRVQNSSELDKVIEKMKADEEKARKNNDAIKAKNIRNSRKLIEALKDERGAIQG